MCDLYIKGHPRRSWLAQVKFLKKELGLQDQVLDKNVTKKASDKIEWREFEIPLQHKSKLQVYRELKREIGFEEYWKYINKIPSRLFLKFRLGTHGLFEKLDRHDKGDWPQECPNCVICKESVERVLSECTSYDSQRLDFLTIWKQSFSRCFWNHSLWEHFDETAFCLREKGGVLVNNECSSWYNSVGDF